jgi:type II restriction/modification system DNA methylase subunit YeeA
MELHGYLDHSFRVLSHPAGQALPEVLGHAEHLDLPGLDRERVIELKMDGTRDEELYRDLLLAQCRALHRAMPFLFEWVDDETELLLPDNLLQTDSLIRDLVSTIPEEDWQEVEIIGWLYQFYISEKKDQVIGKVVKSEDIPAATQLFTPNWIVQYLVQNSVGRLWLMANPASTLKGEWPHYIEPAEQSPEVQAQLDALIQTRMDEDGGSLNPETITVLDPACGSGHILVVAYDVLKVIYLERGYRPRDIPRLILEKNLYGLDIDDRAAQLAAFALVMKARADDRRLLDDQPKLNVLALQESKGLNADELTRSLQPIAAIAGRVSPAGVTRQQAAGFAEDDLFPGTLPQMSLGESVKPETSGYAALTRPTIAALIDTFAEAKTFGSLIQVPPRLAAALPKLASGLLEALDSGDAFARAAAEDLLPLVMQARVLAMHCDAVLANPPYMGSKGMNKALKDHAKTTFQDSKSDLFAMFIEQGFSWCKSTGFNSMVTMQSWMFLSSYDAMRGKLLRGRTIHTMAHLGARAFGAISGDVVQTTAFVLQGHHFVGFKPVFFRLVDGQEEHKETSLRAGLQRFDAITQDELINIPGSPIAYWASPTTLHLFSTAIPLEDKAPSRAGLQTGENEKFIRYWHELSFQRFGGLGLTKSDAAASGKKWFPYNSGGSYRRWHGNYEKVVDWLCDGENIKKDKLDKLAAGLCLPSNSKPKNEQYYFLRSITWTKISSGLFGVRCCDQGSLFDIAGSSIFPSDHDYSTVAGFLCSKVSTHFLGFINQTINIQTGDVGRFPWLHDKLQPYQSAIGSFVKECVEISRIDWDSFETSWDFLRTFTSIDTDNIPTLQKSWEKWESECYLRIQRMMEVEEANNRVFIEAYGLQNELSPEVPEDQITLARADREKDCQRLISYAIGCMMGRYSLDEPGLIYAHAGNIGFAPTRYQTFPADADGIIPITDSNWFDDDAANRIREFLLAVWGTETLNENLAWLAESLGSKSGETPDETIRRYLSSSFFKDHLQTYKRRPIYWCFSSGKQKAFEALVYLHRYHEGTLARMRMEYVVPLQGKMAARIDRLVDDIASASTTAQAKRLQKERDKLTRQLDELRRYDEQLRHYADQRIALDLDDGVKVNYGKFGNLLAEVKTVTGAGAD